MRAGQGRRHGGASGRGRSHGPHDPRPRPGGRLSGGARRGDDARVGRAAGARRPGRGGHLGRRLPAGRLAGDGGARPRLGAGAAPRPCRRRHPAQPPHRLPRRLSRARRRAGPYGDRRLLGPFGRHHGAFRRNRPGLHPGSDRFRDSDRRRPDPGGHQLLHHHQRHDGAAPARGAALPRALGAGRGGPAERRPRRAGRRSAGNAAADRRRRSRA